MPAAMPRFFLPLHAWAHHQDENFTTELLAAVIRSLLSCDREAGIEILEWLTSGAVEWQCVDPATIEVRTQRPSFESIPDMEIRAPGRLVYVECKIESEVDTKQLDRHRNGLERAAAEDGRSRRALVLLTRDPIGDLLIPSNVKVRRWHELAAILESQKRSEGVGKWLSRELFEFLKGRNMAMTRIEDTLIHGIRSLLSLGLMIDQAASRLGLTTKPAVDRREFGRAISDPKQRYSPLKQIGAYVAYDLPEMLRVQFQIDDTASRPRNEVIDHFVFAADYWAKNIDLQEKFFQLPTTGEQQEYILQELSVALDVGRKEIARLPDPS